MTDRPHIHIAERDPFADDAARPLTIAELGAKIDTVGKVVQSQGETMLEIYGVVQALHADVGKMRGELFARVPPGYRWATLAALVAIALALWRMPYALNEPREGVNAVRAAGIVGAP